MIIARLKQITERQYHIILLVIAFIRAFLETMVSYQSFTMVWWLVIMMNILALPIGWLLVHHIAPPSGEMIGAIAAFLIIFAAPLAMAMLFVWYIIIQLSEKLLYILAEYIQPTQTVKPHIFSVAMLFSLAKVPYRLHPISCTLLE